MREKLKCILLVDDDTEDNEFHKMVIEEMNITERIEIALNGLEALNFLKEENQTAPDIIFLDVNMPKMNGWEFLEEYHKLTREQKAKVVIIMLTTSLNPADKKRAEQFPDITDFNSKPLTEEMMNEILARYFPEQETESAQA